ncbi:PREDICTED: putative GPI-anchored protein PB15E9.01c [Wasmannia auropunctata]|uniref:putative GPI-anchored protein PB15E9.01c n=1 Tax=Wasmannia auropunctata TaxID=64793 RepID=UPI0005EF3254|nr:PREDICTED: putative GPI-anchored protein PB15E9.01c [Wasmannia auropunctata]
MWDLGNRGAVVLISVTCGCLLVYNAWGAVLALAFTLLLVVYACYSLLANDSLVSPHAYHVLVYLREAVHELVAGLRAVHGHGTGYVRKLWHSASRCYRERFPSFRMDRRRAGNYQLSSDEYNSVASAVRRVDSSPLSPSSSSSSRFGLIDQLSPIPCVPYLRSRVHDTLGSDSRLYHAGDYDCTLHQQQQSAHGKHTSTPVLKPGGGRENPRNGDVNPIPQSRGMSAKKILSSLNHGENVTQFSPEGSPWGMSISPKMRPRPAGVKTVQTVAGPLLASTRYNIDPKLYTDVSSPGLTTRLTKYATEAKNRLTHLSQYGTGQFPKVNLYANPIPLLNAKMTKMRIPVTVRVAPPDVTKYSPPEKQKILSNICHAENRSPASVVQVLREISLKRHASTDDVSFDVAKKQRTDFFNEERESILEENKQKRGRDESRSDEDLSPQSKSARPAKRTKTRSCYDILNSLTSSVHVAAGVKRKAADFSRSGTPEFEKHFKSLESTQPSISSTVSQSQNLVVDSGKSDPKEIHSTNPETLNSKKVEKFPLVKGILKSSKELRLNSDKTGLAHKIGRNVNEIDNSKSAAPVRSVTLTDKLFMRAEPERNEQFKSLVEEPSSIKVRFATDNVEEIKKEDLRNMRQTSMRARLQSMFDAISGKAENKINPDVVIQAEDVNTVTPPVTLPVTLPVSCATLNSSTTTTNINTTPLSTAAIIPSGFSSSRPSTKVQTKSDTVFSIPKTTSPAQLIVPATSSLETNLIVQTSQTAEQTKVVSIAPAVTSTEKSLEIVSSAPSIAVPTFNFNKPAAEAPAATSNNTLSNFGIGTYSSNTFTPPSSKSTNFLIADKAPSRSTFSPINSNAMTQEKIETSNIVTPKAIVSSSIIENTHTTSSFTFGSNKPILSAVSTQAAVPSLPSQSPGTTLSPVNTTTATSIGGFNSVVNSSTLNSVTTASAITHMFTFQSNTTTLQSPKSDNFTFGQPNSNVQSKINAFGSPVNSQATSHLTTTSFNFTPNTSITTIANSSFTANTTTATAPTFGLSGASTFLLGTTSATSSIPTLSTSKPLFVFGTSNTPSTTSTAIALPAPTTNSTSSLSAIGSNAIPAFGAPITTTTVPQFNASAITVPQFGTPTTTVPQFGTPTTSIFATTSITTTNMFGTTNSSQPLFGTASGSGATSETAGIFNTPATAASSIFVSTTNVVSSSGSTPSSSLFSNVNANSASTTAAPPVFGSGAPIFGQTKPSTSFGTASGMFGSTTAPLFGSTTQTGPTAPAPAPAFGITGNVSTTTITPSFDTTNNTTPAFGAPGVGTATNVQATQPAFGGTTGSIFGSTDNTTASVPIFGANATPATETFGISSVTSTFGTQNPPSLTFGAASAGGGGGGTTTFGDNKSLFGATPATSPSFGGSNPSVPAFGASNANNASSSTNNMFVFGGAQKDGQQNPTFSFASNFNAGSSNSAAAPAPPFQFGAPSAKPATPGFNFTAPPAAPTLNFGTTAAPTFNPSTPGMFSIGSGSTAPRSRTIRSRKPR